MRLQDDAESKLFEAFENSLTRLQKLDTISKHYDRDKIILLKALLDIRQEIDLLKEIKDTRDEINIILSVLRTQLEVVEQMRSRYHKRFYLLEDSTVSSIIKNDIAEFARMDNQAKNVQDKVSKLARLSDILKTHRSIL